jgi:hypothetical protein
MWGLLEARAFKHRRQGDRGAGQRPDSPLEVGQGFDGGSTRIDGITRSRTLVGDVPSRARAFAGNSIAPGMPNPGM